MSHRVKLISLIPPEATQEMKKFAMRAKVYNHIPYDVGHFICSHFLDEQEMHGLMYAYVINAEVRHIIKRFLKAKKPRMERMSNIRAQNSENEMMGEVHDNLEKSIRHSQNS